MTISAGQVKFEEEKRSHIIANRPVNMCKDQLQPFTGLINLYSLGRQSDLHRKQKGLPYHAKGER
jgi:hypothetical protein